MKKRGFTLIELLVVIAIIAILAAILFPVFASAREKARAVACMSNEKQLGLAVEQYLSEYDENYVPPYVGYDQTSTDGSSQKWCHLLYPYVKSPAAYVCPDNRYGASYFPFQPLPLSGGNTTNTLATGSYAINSAYIWQAYEPTSKTNPGFGLFLALQGVYVLNGVVSTTASPGAELAYPPSGQPQSRVLDPAGTVFITECGLYDRFLLDDGRALTQGPIATGTITNSGGSISATNYGGNQGLPWFGPQPLFNYKTTGQYTGIGEHNNGVNLVFADGHAKWRNVQSIAGHTDPNGVDVEWSAGAEGSSLKG